MPSTDLKPNIMQYCYTIAVLPPKKSQMFLPLAYLSISTPNAHVRLSNS